MARESLDRQDLVDKLQMQKNIDGLPNWCDWTAGQAEDWIELNVNNIAAAKNVLKKMAKMLIYLRDGLV